jgi:hypothetical protein
MGSITKMDPSATQQLINQPNANPGVGLTLWDMQPVSRVARTSPSLRGHEGGSLRVCRCLQT